MKKLMVALAFLFYCITARAYSQDNPRDILEKAIKAHGGSDGLLKLRSAQVTYQLKGKIPGIGMEEKWGPMDALVVETYLLPKKMKKVINTSIKGKQLEIEWALLGDKYWYRDEKGTARWLKQEIETETTFRPYLILENMPSFLDKEVRLEFDQGQTPGASPIGITVYSEKRRISTTLFFDKNSYLLTSSISTVPGRQENYGQADFLDYQDIDGIKLFMVEKMKSNGIQTVEFVVKKVQFKSVSDDYFLPESKSAFPWIWIIIGFSVLGGAIMLARKNKNKKIDQLKP